MLLLGQDAQARLPLVAVERGKSDAEADDSPEEDVHDHGDEDYDLHAVASIR